MGPETKLSFLASRFILSPSLSSIFLRPSPSHFAKDQTRRFIRPSVRMHSLRNKPSNSLPPNTTRNQKPSTAPPCHQQNLQRIPEGKTTLHPIQSKLAHRPSHLSKKHSSLPSTHHHETVTTVSSKTTHKKTTTPSHSPSPSHSHEKKLPDTKARSVTEPLRKKKNTFTFLLKPASFVCGLWHKKSLG